MPRIKILFIISVIIFIGAYSLSAYDVPGWFPFNEKNALKGWEEKIFRNRVLYVIEAKPNHDGYLSATSHKACSGLVYRLKFNATKLPMISWQWTVSEFPNKKKENQNPNEHYKPGWVEQDDYAARVYVIFPSWNFMNIKSLEYVWDDDLPKGTIVTSPFSSNIKLFVVESGKENVNKWVLEERNIFEDYQKAFGRAGNIGVGAIALMTDSDNSISTAEASYKDLKVGYTK